MGTNSYSISPSVDFGEYGLFESWNLDVEQRRSILHLVLTDDTNCLKSNFVLFNTVAESHVKAPKDLEPRIERLVTGSSTTFELSYFGWIMCIRCTDDGILSTVAIVTNSLLSSGDLGFEAFAAEDIDVMISSWKRAIHPNKGIVVHRNPKLIVYTSLIELVGVKPRVF